MSSPRNTVPAELKAQFRHACGADGRPAPAVPPGDYLVLCLDTLVEEVHFFPGADPRSLGHKALAVNLSDLAAMGAGPIAVAVAVCLPDRDARWLNDFAAGLRSLAEEFGTTVTGADVDDGPRAVTVEALGTVPGDRILRRNGARAGDDVYVTGNLGDAALAVAAIAERVALTPAQVEKLAPRLHRPQPRLAAGRALGGVATAAIDVSDGLAADLQHILDASMVGATIDVATLPLSRELREMPFQDALGYALGGGDDYELCFTAPPGARPLIGDIGQDCGIAISRIGCIETAPGLRLVPQDRVMAVPPAGYTHFS